MEVTLLMSYNAYISSTLRLTKDAGEWLVLSSQQLQPIDVDGK